MIELISPSNNKKILLNNKIYSKFITDAYQIKNVEKLEKELSYMNSHVNVLDYYKNGVNYTNPKPVIFRFKDSIDGKYELHLISNSEKIIPIKNHSVKIYNLIPNVNYTWYIVNTISNDKSDVYSFIIKDNYRVIKANYVTNIRDLGGKVTKDNKVVKYGLIYRGPELNPKQYDSIFDEAGHVVRHVRNLYPKGIRALQELGIKTDLDLRGDKECSYLKKAPLKSKYYACSYKRIHIDGYEDLFMRYKKEIKDILEFFADINNYPVYFHCASGADRTGTIAFILEAILNVNYIDQIVDFEITSLIGSLRRFADFDGKYDYGVFEITSFKIMMDYLKEYKVENETLNDCIVRFVVSECGVLKETIDVIRKILLN